TGSSALYTHYNETVTGVRVIKAFGLRQYMEKDFNYKANNLFILGMRLILNSNWLSPALHLISACGVAGGLYLGANLILEGTITSGAFVSFIAALMMLYAPLKAIGNNYISVQMSLLALDRIYDILNRKSFEEGSEENKLKLDSIKSNIEFKNVHFSYDKKREILKGINLTIPVSKKIALVGNSGGGKTTVCSLIPRLYNVTKGSILIDGKNIKDYSLSSLRYQIAVVFQDNFLFEGTIRENIVCARENATEEEIQTAVKSACLDEFLKTLPQGIDTKIGERGVTLSGGQKQRVAIARAIIKNASLVILDEATSALDNKSEKIVQQALDNLMKGKTTIVIAHRLSTIRDADQIVVLNDGQIAEQGTHEELLEKKGVYANLYLSQFK
ncbi:ABC transporter ATP-binding protein, partial [Succinatimonas hippei]|uniref:ABC transporter ATP-binding protein n=1 Tax=Succinatimonas hippei TaxID=626938 RepID=UPI0024919519